MTSDELERPCWICANARKVYIAQHWVTMPRIDNTDENCGHRELELSIARNRYRRKPVASEVLFNPVSPVRVA